MCEYPEQSLAAAACDADWLHSAISACSASGCGWRLARTVAAPMQVETPLMTNSFYSDPACVMRYTKEGFS